MIARLRILSLIILTAAACGTDGPVAGPSPEESTEHDLSWLQANVLRIRTDAPDGDYSDLMPLKQIIGDARIVALGEGTHGTREFFRMKDRLLRFLVQEMGFDLFGIEAAWAESNRVDDYVRTGQGDPHRLLSGLYFWTWNTQEVLDMILWMRQHNTAHPDGVRFLGFDMQFSTMAMDEIVDYLIRIDPAVGGVIGSAYNCWRTWERATTYAGATLLHEECRSGVQSVYDHLAAHRDEYIEKTSREEYEHVLRAARVVVQDEHLSSRRWVNVETNPRDRYMAENAQWLLEQAGPDSRIVLWAHNAHVMDSPGWMGNHLRQQYGGDMVVVGFSFGTGGLSAVPFSGSSATGPVRALQADTPSKDSYEHHFGLVGEPRFLLDLRKLRGPLPESAAWLRGPMQLRMIGAGYDVSNPERYYWTLPLHEPFDVWIHFETATASELLPFVN